MNTAISEEFLKEDPELPIFVETGDANDVKGWQENSYAKRITHLGFNENIRASEDKKTLLKAALNLGLIAVVNNDKGVMVPVTRDYEERLYDAVKQAEEINPELDDEFKNYGNRLFERVTAELTEQFPEYNFDQYKVDDSFYTRANISPVVKSISNDLAGINISKNDGSEVSNVELVQITDATTKIVMNNHKNDIKARDRARANIVNEAMRKDKHKLGIINVGSSHVTGLIKNLEELGLNVIAANISIDGKKMLK